MFGEALPAASLDERLAWLEEFSTRWDFRAMAREKANADPKSQDAGGSSRWEISLSGLGPETEKLVISLCDRLGLVSAIPPSRSAVDYLVVLGGARSANLLRPKHAMELIDAGQLTTKEVILLGGSRAVLDSERDATDVYAPGAQTEFDLLTMGAAKAFGISASAYTEDRGEDPANANANWRIWRLPDTGSDLEVPLTAIEAPSREPESRRANTADSYAFFAERMAPSHASVLLVTSQIYVPYQHLEAVRGLAIPFGLELETIGFPPSWLSSNPSSTQQAANYLQETRSTILAARRLFDEWLDDTVRG